MTQIWGSMSGLILRVGVRIPEQPSHFRILRPDFQDGLKFGPNVSGFADYFSIFPPFSHRFFLLSSGRLSLKVARNDYHSLVPLN